MGFTHRNTQLAKGALAFAMAVCLACSTAVPPLAAADPQPEQAVTTEAGQTSEPQTETEVSETPEEQEDESSQSNSDESDASAENTDKAKQESPDASKDSKAKSEAKGKSGKKTQKDAAADKTEPKDDDKAGDKMSEKEIASHVSAAYDYSQQASAALYELNSLASEFPSYIETVDKAHKGVVKVQKKLKKLKKRAKKIEKRIERAQEVIDAANEELAASQGTDLMSVMAGRASFDDIDSKAYLLQKAIADRESAITRAQVAQAARTPKAKMLAKQLKKAKKRERGALEKAGAKASELEQSIAAVRRYDRLAQEEASSASSHSSEAEKTLSSVKATTASHERELADKTDMLITWYTSANAASGVDAHQEITGIALSYLGVKYVWGGETPEGGFDCSGLTMYCYAKIGKQLTHFAQTQYSEGRHIEKDALMPGDLVFFGTGMDNITHVGIYLGNGEFVHAPHEGDVVKVTKLSIMSNYVAACRP